jgi:uncharacterized protein
MPAWLSTLIMWITLVIMLVGLVGLIVPVFPGIAIMWLAALGYGVVTGFNTLGWVLFGVITVLSIGAMTVDNLLMAVGGRKEGAAWYSLGLGMLAGLLFTIIFPPFGGLIAAPLAVFLLEYLRQKDLDKALLTLRGLAVGWGASFVVRFLLGLTIIGVWLVWAVNR